LSGNLSTLQVRDQGKAARWMFFAAGLVKLMRNPMRQLRRMWGNF
jgi:hypothetical protein